MEANRSEAGIIELLLRWEGLRARGESVSAEELAADMPELATELARRIAVILSNREHDRSTDHATRGLHSGL